MLIPIACRFVPYDQWFLTHLDDGSKVKQIKLWILSRCNLVQSPGPRAQRPVSPITFASSVRSRSSVDSLEDGYNEDDEFSDQDLLPVRHPPSSKAGFASLLDPKPGPSVQPGSSPIVDHYTLLSFSTGTMLEDEFTFSWYNFRPYELLEMHPAGIITPLQRDVLAEYIQPYFQAKVRILRAVWNHRSGRFEPPGVDSQTERGGHKAVDKMAHRLDTFSPKSSTLRSEKRRKKEADWKTRWVVINHGILSLCKEHVTSPPLRQFALSTMSALRGADALQRAYYIVTRPRVVCIKFRPCPASATGITSPPPSSPSSSAWEDLRTNVQEFIPHIDSASDLKQTTEQGHARERFGEYACDPDEACRGVGEWIVLDMLDDHAFSSILRILHRQASHSISSSFVPSSPIITLSRSIVPPVGTSSISCDTIPYPEWRINTVENARKAGMGDVGKPMAWVLWTEKGLGESLLGNIRHHRQVFSREMQYKTSTLPSDMYGSDDDSDDDSEIEWEGWMRDLERQGQVRERSEKAARFSAPRLAGVSTSVSGPPPLPSPPLSEASPSGSPRARSPSLPVSHLASDTRYPNIGNVIRASGLHGHCPTEHPDAPEKNQSTIFSTVRVGTAPSSRRRSSTLFAESAGTTKRERDKGRRDGPSSPGAAGVNVGSGSTSGGMQSSPRSSVRHTRSNSNLRMSSPHGTEGGAGPTSLPKRQSPFVRGMSLRASKIVEGLEAAIDFVDEKSV